MLQGAILIEGCLYTALVSGLGMGSGWDGRLRLNIADLFKFVSQVRRKEFFEVGVLGLDASPNFSFDMPSQVYVNLLVESMTSKARYLVEFFLGLRTGLESGIVVTNVSTWTSALKSGVNLRFDI